MRPHSYWKCCSWVCATTEPFSYLPTAAPLWSLGLHYWIFFTVTSLGLPQSQICLVEEMNSAFMALTFRFSVFFWHFLISWLLFSCLHLYLTHFSLSGPLSITAGMFLRQTEVDLESIQHQLLFKWRGFCVMTCVGKTDRGHSQSFS